LPIGYSGSNPIVITETLPAGTNISILNNAGWTQTNSGDTYTFTISGTGSLGTGLSLPPISFTLEGSTNGYTTTSTVYSDAEQTENQSNNSASATVTSESLPPTVISPIYYNQGEAAEILTAAADSGNELIWYLNQGAAPSSIAFTPDTSELGSTIYYVRQQSPGGCISDYAEIEVIIVESPTPGSITGGDEICVNSTPTLIDNAVGGTGAGSLSYRWEYSKDNGTNWEEIAGESTAILQPSVIQTDTQYRRITLADSGDHISESIPSNVVTFTTKNCMVISNPMLPSKAK